MSKYRFSYFITDDYIEIKLSDPRADAMYQPWIDSHPEYLASNGQPTGDQDQSKWYDLMADIANTVLGTEQLDYKSTGGVSLIDTKSV